MASATRWRARACRCRFRRMIVLTGSLRIIPRPHDSMAMFELSPRDTPCRRFGGHITVDSAATDEIGAAARSNRTTTKLSEEGTATMKLTTITMVTVGGVMQGLGGADEDRRGGFERGGWVGPLFDNDAGASLNQVYQRADAFLFGRRPCEIFARSWGAADWGASAGIELGSNPMAAALN